MCYVRDLNCVELVVDPDDGKINDDITQEEFQTRVINFLKSTGEQDKSNVGSAPDWTLFNKDGDNTQLIIHTPGNPKYTGAQPMTNEFTEYPNKVKAISDIVVANVPGAQSLVHLYDPLDYTYLIDPETNDGYNTGPDAERVNKNARGFCVFQ